MERLYDARYHYTGYHHCRCHCRLRIYTAPGHPAVVIATEADDNPGTSITNMAGPLATQVAQAFALQPGFVWIEHYPARGFFAGRPRFPEVFAQVTFPVGTHGLHHPHWQPLSTVQVEALIGQALS